MSSENLTSLTDHVSPGTEGRKNANSTRCSQEITHSSTNRARLTLTSVIGREPASAGACKNWILFAVDNWLSTLYNCNNFSLIQGLRRSELDFHSVKLSGQGLTRVGNSWTVSKAILSHKLISSVSLNEWGLYLPITAEIRNKSWFFKYMFNMIFVFVAVFLFHIIYFCLDCFESASRNANGERSRQSAAR